MPAADILQEQARAARDLGERGYRGARTFGARAMQGAGSMYGATMATRTGSAFMRGAGEAVGLSYAFKPDAPEWIKSMRGARGRAAEKAFMGAMPKRHAFTGVLGLGEPTSFARAERAALKATWGADIEAGRRFVSRNVGADVAGNIGKVRWGSNAMKGMGVKTLMRAAGPAFVAYAAYEGYKEGGIWGGVTAGAKEIAMFGAFNAAISILGGPLSIGIAATAAVGGAGYVFGEAAQGYRKRMRDIELGGNLVDPHGTMATMRQRSLMALNNSHINGRIAMGNEATLMHR